MGRDPEQWEGPPEGAPEGASEGSADSSLDAGLEAAFEGGAAFAAAGARPSNGAGASVVRLLSKLGARAQRMLLRDESEPEGSALQRASHDSVQGVAAAGRYHVLGEIGRGGVGVVLKSHDEDLGRNVAIKVLREDRVRDPALVLRFIEEAQIAGQLEHPGIAPVYDLGVSADERPYFSMRLIKGRTLASLLAERMGPLDGRPRFLAIFSQVCQTMAYAHSRGVIHRDLKPTNIMVGAFGEVQVVDWGFAKVLARRDRDAEWRSLEPPASVIETVRSGSASSSESVEGSVFGTPAYMSPEQARGEIEDVDERSDVFALGAILCELLTGKPPYVRDRRETLQLAADAELEDAFARLSACDADAELLSLARHCLAQDVAARPANAGVVARIVQEHLTNAEDRAHKAEIAAARAEAKTVAERRARRLTLALGATIIVALLGGTVGYLAYERHERTRDNRLTQSARAALKDATFERGKGVLQAALAAVGRAEAVTAEGTLDTSLLTEISTLRQALEGEIASAQVRHERDLREQELLAALERASVAEPEMLHAFVVSEDHLPTDQRTQARDPLSSLRDAAFAQAFRAFGLDFQVLSDDSIVDALQSTPIAGAISGFLHCWAEISQRANSPTEGERLLEIAHRIVPDPWCRRVHDARNRGELLALATSTESEHLPPHDTVLLCQVLREQGGVTDAIDVLQRAVRRQPGEYLLRLNLGHALEQASPPRSQEALTNTEAALALRPTTIWIAALRNDLLRRVGRSGDALLEAKDLAYRHPDSYLALVRLAALLDDHGDFGDAGRCAHAAIELNPSGAYAHHVLAFILLHEGQIDASLLERKAAAERNEFYFGALGDALRDAHRNGEAIEAYRRAVKVADAFKSYLGMYDSYIALGNVDLAIDAIHKAIEVSDGAPPADVAHLLWHLGIHLGQRGDTKAAIQQWRKSLELDPDQPEALEWIAFKLLATKQYDEAIDYGRRLTSLAPSNVAYIQTFAELIYEVGVALHEEGACGCAEALFREVIERVPDAPGTPRELEEKKMFALRQLAYCLCRHQNKAREAADSCRQAIDIDASMDDTHLLLGCALQEMGDRRGAAVAYREYLQRMHARASSTGTFTAARVFPSGALSLDDAHGLACLIAVLPTEDAERSALLRELKQRCNDSRDDVSALYNAATAFSALAFRKVVDPAEAVTAFEDVLDVDPEHVDALVELARLLTLDPDLDVFDPERALELIERAQSHAPDMETVRHMKGVVLYRMGRYQAGIEALLASREAREALPGRLEDWLFLSMAYHELGDRQQSEACFKQIGEEPRPDTSLDEAYVALIESEARRLVGR